MEKITLTEEQARRFMENFKKGDIWGLEELGKILKYELKINNSITTFSIYDVIACVVNLNMAVEFLETYKNTPIDKCSQQIFDLYDKLKDCLFEQFTNDFTKYWEEE